MVILARAPRVRRPDEQISPIEDGLVVFDTLGTCRLEIKGGAQSLGVFLMTSTTPESPFLGERDYWYWKSGVQPWPDVFELHYAPGVALPSVTPEVHPQVVFTSAALEHDLSASGLSVWRVRRAELVQGVPIYEELGYFVRTPSGVLDWYADALPPESSLVLEEGQWLRLTRINNNNGMVLELARATPGPIG